MEIVKLLAVIAYRQIQTGQRAKAVVWWLPFLVVTFYLVYRMVTQTEAETLALAEGVRWFGGQVDVNVLRVAIIVLFYMASSVAAYLDFYFREEEVNADPLTPIQPEAPVSHDHVSWEMIMTAYLKGEHDSALTLTEQQAKKDKKDPFPQFMLAKLFALKGERQKAVKFLAKCRKLDRRHDLAYECDQLVVLMELKK